MSPRVLIVDDEPDWRDGFRDIFVTLGLSADTAPDRETARELLDSGTYDLLVLDIYLSPAQPPIDYQRFLGFLRTAHPALKVVTATGKPLAPDEAFELNGLGVVGFLYKPQVRVAGVRDLLARLGLTGPDHAPSEQRLDRLEKALTDGFALLGRQNQAVLTLLAADVTDCPRLFTLQEVPGGRAGTALRTGYRLTLWCELPGGEHSWEPATYTFHETREWLRRIAPYALRVSNLLRMVVPVAAAVPGVILPDDDLKRIQHQLDLLKAVAAQLPAGLPADGGASGVRAEEGAGLRALRGLLMDLDEARAFGDLRKVVTEGGQILWVCPRHRGSGERPGVHLPSG
jgi:CheY-like chemotaxis protein